MPKCAKNSQIRWLRNLFLLLTVHYYHLGSIKERPSGRDVARNVSESSNAASLPRNLSPTGGIAHCGETLPDRTNVVNTATYSSNPFANCSTWNTYRRNHVPRGTFPHLHRKYVIADSLKLG